MGGSLEFLWRTHAYINEYIRFADAKALGIIALLGAYLGFVLDRVPEDATQLGKILFIAAVATSCLAIGAAAWTVFPRTGGSPYGIVYWEAIRTRIAAAYSAEVAVPERELTGSLSGHVYELAGVAKRKYAALQFSFGAGFVAFILDSAVVLFL